MTDYDPKYHHNPESLQPLYRGIDGPFYAKHFNGYTYAIFSGAAQALAYWRGLDVRSRQYFHIENEKGETMRFAENSRGHAYAILDALDRAEGKS